MNDVSFPVPSFLLSPWDGGVCRCILSLFSLLPSLFPLAMFRSIPILRWPWMPFPFSSPPSQCHPHAIHPCRVEAPILSHSDRGWETPPWTHRQRGKEASIDPERQGEREGPTV